MTTNRNLIAIQNSVNYFHHAQDYYKKLIENLHAIGSASDDEKGVLIDKASIYLKELSKYTNKISMTVLENGGYPKDIIDGIYKEIEMFREAITYTERFLIGKKLLDSSIYNLEVLIEKSNIDKFEYFRYANSEKELAKKLAIILVDPKHVMSYKPLLMKISNGRMDVEEFKKLFNSIKSKLPFVKTNESFISFSEFKKL